MNKKSTLKNPRLQVDIRLFDSNDDRAEESTQLPHTNLTSKLAFSTSKEQVHINSRKNCNHKQSVNTKNAYYNV